MKNRIVDAISVVLKESPGLTYQEVYERIVKQELYQFGAKKPNAVVNGEIRCHCQGLDFPSASPVKYFKIVGQRGKDNLYALVDSAESPLCKNTDVETTTVKLRFPEDALPEEQIDLSYLFYKDQLKKDILNHIIECHPSFFENLVVKLLVGMGYGADESSGTTTRLSRDGGIDGIIYEDKLGLSRIYIQAKRYGNNNTVGRPDLQAFVGAMEDVQKGVFITTSSFSKDAREYASKQQQKSLKLIDGDLLAELMIKYGIGLEKVHSYVVYRINEDFYELGE